MLSRLRTQKGTAGLIVAPGGGAYASSDVAAAPSRSANRPRPASASLPGPRSRTDGAGGPQPQELHPGSRDQVARGRRIASPTSIRPSQLASAGTCRGVPASSATQQTRPAREAGPKEEN